MGLFNLSKPKWQHKSAEVRLAALTTESDGPSPDELVELISDDPDPRVRLAALDRLAELPLLSLLAEKLTDGDIKKTVTLKKDTLLKQKLIGAQTPDTFREDLAGLTDPEMKAEVAGYAHLPEIRMASLATINDEDLLARVAQAPCGKEATQTALAGIHREDLLQLLTTKASGKTGRRLASEKLAALDEERRRNDPDTQRQNRLLELLAIASGLSRTELWDKTDDELPALRQEWQSLDPTGNHPRKDEFETLCAAFEEQYRSICSARAVEKEKAERYQALIHGFEEICRTIEGLTGSQADDAPQKMAEAVRSWHQLATSDSTGLGPTTALTKKFAQVEQSFRDTHQKIEREKNILATMLAKIKEVSDLIARGQLEQAERTLVDLEKTQGDQNFRHIPVHDLDLRLTELRTSLSETRATALQNILNERTRICEALAHLQQDFTPTSAEQKLKDLRQTWENLGSLGPGQDEDLLTRYTSAVTQISEMIDAFQHERDWQLWANLTLKNQLIARVKDLDTHENLELVYHEIREARQAWKNIGPIPPKVSQKKWLEFDQTCNRNFERCKPYLDELEGKRAAAITRREEICQRAEELSESSEWQKTTDELKALQGEWKDLLRGRRGEEEQLFRRFRKACDAFFARRQSHLEQQDQQREGNLKDKIALCEQAEQLLTDLKADEVTAFLDLQKRWKTIGPAPRKKEAPLWTRFRSACDTFFNWLDEQRRENISLKEGLCSEVEALAKGITPDADLKEVADQAKQLQQQWKEIGPVPHDLQESLWQRFRAPCDVIFSALQQQYEVEDEERSSNQTIKESLLQQAEELVEKNLDDKETAEDLKALQQKWQETGPAPREHDGGLNRQFRAICNAFFEGRRQQFAELRTERNENLKKKEILCLRLENIVGSSIKSGGGGRGKALTLAEELKQAMEDNFILAGRRDEKNGLDEDVKKISQDWQKIGAVPREQEQHLNKRYKSAMDRYYKKKSNKKPPQTAKEASAS
ncbi:MAG: DUF349 domain-containing protein [Proteobacteria bacterium]|nr:DUF349 domain-containing protein [Pseudomonadota bacterium]MBU1688117.1 DUF349 domain-containing protein [Pseudomonadota bacterium]